MDPFCGHAPAIHSELAQLRKTRQSMQTVSIAVAVVGAGWVATRLSFILIPLLLAYLVTFMLSPLLDLLESKPLVWGARVRMVPRPAALLATILAAFAALAATFVVARSSWDQFECSRGLERLAEVDRNASSWLAARGFRAVGNSSLLMGNAEQAGSLDMAELQSALGWLSEAANSAVTILLLAVYLILEREQGQWQQQAPDARHDRAYMQRGKGKAFKGSGESAQQMEALLRFYVELKTSISFVTGLLVGITLYCFGVPLSPVFALSAFACNFVPNIGSFVSILLPVPVVLIQPACTPATCVGCACLSASGKALAIALPSALQLYVVNFLEPLLFGQSLNLTPFSVLASLVFWALLWGLPGAVLSTPLLGAMKIALSTSRHAVARYVLSLIRKYDIDDQSQLALERSRVLQRLSLKNQVTAALHAWDATRLRCLCRARGLSCCWCRDMLLWLEACCLLTTLRCDSSVVSGSARRSPARARTAPWHCRRPSAAPSRRTAWWLSLTSCRTRTPARKRRCPRAARLRSATSRG